MSLVKENFVQSSWTCLHLSFTPLLLVRDVLSTESIVLASTSLNTLRILKHSIIFLRSLHSSRENRYSRASLSLYGLIRKDVIISVSLRWTASSLAISFAWWFDQNCIAYSRWGLTKLIYRGRITFLFWSKKFLFIKLNIRLTLPAASLHRRAGRNSNAKVFDTLYAFGISAIYLSFKFLVPCTCRMWHLLILKGISHLWDHSDLFLRSSWRLILSWSVIIEFPILASSGNFGISLFSPTSMSLM